MTPEDFLNTSFSNKDEVEYKGRRYNIAALDFEEHLIGICEFEDSDISWKRCENVNYFKHDPASRPCAPQTT